MSGAPSELLQEIAAAVGTPAYVYDAAALDAAVARWTAVAPADRVHYSVKANGNLALLARLSSHGLGFEVATSGEYGRVRAAGVASDRVIFGGVPKSASTVALAAVERPSLLVLQSRTEVAMLERLDAERRREGGDGVSGPPLRLGIRVRPAIRAGAHPSLHTGVREAKFGMRPDAVPEAWRRLGALRAGRPVALAVHIGSGLERAEPYRRAVALLLRLAVELSESDPPVEELDLGGGLGVDYGGGEDPDPAALLGPLVERARERGLGVRFEPGRSLVARCGTLLTRVLYRWADAPAPALVCDAGFTDFARQVLYGAEHRIEPLRGEPRGEPTVSVLGPTCESGDRLGTGRRLHGIGEGDVLAVRDVGAYGFCMASNYMSRPRPAEVLIEDGEWRVVRPREPLEALWDPEETGIGRALGGASRAEGAAGR